MQGVKICAETITLGFSMTHLPKFLMSDIDWQFEGSQYSNQSAFESAVHDYHKRMNSDGLWNPKRIALSAPSIRIELAERTKTILKFESDDHVCFTEGELLFKIHNALIAKRNKISHTFFEGLQIGLNQEQGMPLLYRLFLGS
jgi:hypothetical protein